MLALDIAKLQPIVRIVETPFLGGRICLPGELDFQIDGAQFSGHGQPNILSMQSMAPTCTTGRSSDTPAQRSLLVVRDGERQARDLVI